MGERESHRPGAFSWADLGTTDATAAKAFYGRLFGWEAVDVQTGDAGTYTRFRQRGHDVAAVYEMGEEERERMPPHWSSYVTVEDAGAAVARARELGAEVVAEPLDVDGAGRMAVIRDPTGAILHFWQAGEEIGATVVNDPGAMVWNELASPDPERAGAFYGELFGWSTETDGSGYATIRCGGALNGGIRPLREGEAPGWLVYFTVESLDEATAAARSAGGRVLAGPLPGMTGRIAIVADPQGAVLALYEGAVDP